MVLLKDVTLAAIVRDEIVNPAGGVERWARSVLPYVEEAVVVDTGSVDGTREKLEELQKEFPHMRVYGREFDDFSSSRNYALDQVVTGMVLVLDADEILADENKSIIGAYKKLSKFLKDNPAVKYHFDIYDPVLNIVSSDAGYHERLFASHPLLRFENKVWEYLTDPSIEEFGKICNEVDVFKKRLLVNPLAQANVSLIHFLPQVEGSLMKLTEHYHKIFEGVSPSTLPSFKKWKAFDPRRDEYN